MISEFTTTHVQRQRCNRLERFFKVEVHICFKTAYANRAVVNFYSAVTHDRRTGPRLSRF
jgi:hypothetical protein